VLKKQLSKTASLIVVAVVAALLTPTVNGADVPATLPDPDGKPGDVTKPVKVYILAGQSNMVGMGDLGGAKNMFTSEYLSSDPAAPKGPLSIYKVGNYNVEALSLYQADGSETDKPIGQGQFEVLKTGVYQFQCGSGDSSFSTMAVEGKQVYSRTPGEKPVKQEMALKAGERYSFTISDSNGDAPRFWLQKMDLLGYGDLEAVAKREGKFPWLLDGEGNWSVRNDVYFQEARLAEGGKGSPLSATSNGKSIGPELGFGHVMGTFHDEQVLLIKTAQGNRSLGYDFRPPSSGRTDPDSEWESAEYKLMVEGVRKTLDSIEKVVPDYKGQGFEIAGFVWFQGHKDSFSEELIAEYEQNLVNMINDVRKEFKAPKMPAVVATIGFGGQNMADKFARILEAQLAVGDANKHPEFAGNVASVDIRNFWREVSESPTNQDYHYNRNAETYMLVGDALGRAMVGLSGGRAESLPQAPRSKTVARQDGVELTKEETAAAQAALAPIILDGIAADYIASPRYNPALLQEAASERPQRASQFLRGAMYGLENCYRAAGIDDYEWQPFGPDLRELEWDYFSFDPPEVMPKDKGNRYRKVTYPAGMENWYATDFDAKKAGWKTGLPPFGQLDGKPEPLGTCDFASDSHCGCGVAPKTSWEKEVLLIRGTFEIPPLKDGCRYRLVVGGSNHVNAGEGFAIYINGKMLSESKVGVFSRQGGQPRGGHIYTDFHEEFKGGEVTIAVTSFLRYNHPRTSPYPPRGHITLWMEEQKVPPIEKAETR